ncbi:RNA polymerase sigma factor [Nonomuraea sp. NPDC050394]|uniref:RNA polymerase sigma factor n=1 Tax=Nonomuraea sp. NPDC050394 TaxID=3364363 RepID=UPI00378A94BF
MAGWPNVDRADDHELAQGLRRGDTDAPAKLYDAYAERLHDYACSLTGDRDSAADSVHDALVTAQGGAGRLQEAAKLRAWLYALTRFQAAARMARKDGAPAGPPPPVLEEPEDPELAALVYEVLGELSKNEREVLELSLRHGLTPAEVGSVLGLTSRQSATRLGRARDHLENAAAAVLLARTGRAHCPDLSAMVDSWEGPLTLMLRRRLSGHIGGCEVCTEGRHRQVAAAKLLDMVPVAYPPISLRRRVVDTCVNPELDHARTLIMERGDNFDRTGFPVEQRGGRGSRRRRPRRLAPVVLAGVAVLAGTGAMALMNGESGGPAAAMPTSSPSESRAPMSVPTDEPVDEELTEEPAPDPTTPDPEPTRSGPAPRVTPTDRPGPPATKPASNPTRTRRPAPGARLSVGCPSSISGAAKVGLTARNASVSWTSGPSEGLGVFPASGTIKAGASASIWVTVDDPEAAGSGTVTFSSNGGAATCALSWRGRQAPTQEPTPSEEPTPTGEPTETPGEAPE